jgi:mannose-6-phosphate isomerase-like protein (cupin superfamily)
MSFQKHLKRNEIWLVSEGSCVVNSAIKDPEQELNKIILNKFDHHIVPVEQWHQICNPFDETVHIIEIQYGKECKEEDIERYFRK